MNAPKMTPSVLFSGEMVNPATGAGARIQLDTPGDGRCVLTVRRFNAAGVQTSVVIRSVLALYPARREGDR